MAVGVPEFSYSITEAWNMGFTADVTLRNDESKAFPDWRIEFDFTSQITSIWNARIVSQSGTRYVIEGPAWDNDLDIGETATFGFVGLGTGAAPTNVVFSGISTEPSPGSPPTLAIGDVTVIEGNNGEVFADLVVRLSNASENTVTVEYATADGTATAGSDYRASSGELTFAAGEVEKTVRVAVLGDLAIEPTETFSVILGNATNASILDGNGVVTILDDDAPPPVEGVPAKPLIYVRDDVGSDGKYTVGFNLWSGINGTSWRLVENGVVIHAASLVASSPNAQTASVEITGRYHGAYTYQVELVNASGATVSDAWTHVVGGASKILLTEVDVGEQAAQITVSLGVTEFDLSVIGSANGSFRVSTNNRSVIAPVVVGGKLRIEGLEGGRASVKIEETTTGEIRYLGVRVRTATGELPGLPDYLAMGSVSEDIPGDLEFWRDFDSDLTNKRMDIRYIYLNGGPENGWRSWQDGLRLQSFLRESLKLGMVPYFVWYNIPDGGESYFTNKEHIESQAYLEGYFNDLKYALDTIRAMAGDETVGFILEPDFLGYLMQIGRVPADQVLARTDAVYSSGVLSRAVDPAFADNVQGLVQAINYTISKLAPNVTFGWQFNLWASPGITTSIPNNGLMHLTDSMGWGAGRAAIASEAREIALYYMNAGILSHGADFVSIDKYGLDAVGYESFAANDPARSTWFWNIDHWNNYLLFCQTLHETTGLPVTLWQIPVGHVNDSLAMNPYSESGRFTPLANTTARYEDSAGTYFLGDRFTASGARWDYFSTNVGGDPGVSTSGSTITWSPHLSDAVAAGITAILFGAGVGISTDGVGSPPTDGYWWITKVQEYYLDPASLNEAPAPRPASLAIDDVTVTEGNVGTTDAVFTVRLSAPQTHEVTVDYSTVNGAATSPSDYVATSGRLTFAPGETAKSILVRVVGDTVLEGDETFFVQLANVVGATLANGQGVGTIKDDDAPLASPFAVFTVTEDWGSGFTGEIKITNTQSLTLASWILEFDFAGQISSIWNAKILDQVGTRYRIQAENWNGTLAPGASVSFGFVGSRASTAVVPTNFLFTGADMSSLAATSTTVSSNSATARNSTPVAKTTKRTRGFSPVAETSLTGTIDEFFSGPSEGLHG